ncbi:YeiH family protein [Halogeometricum limi]|uniref:Conserved hypothetical integral membrane protein n=1 Tax=Halogeometricum limi TaxID=555875 RepID=A0A1I6IDU0_9EURY|nr:putative sulfate exporter family transporter [Halogeometricum limi]SFR64868.1 conserved hypothetical integral membrane protein [Halogeometricum limi]
MSEHGLRNHARNLGWLVALGVLAHLLSGVVAQVSALVVAVVLGALVSNTVGVPTAIREGYDYHKLLLEVGIVLLGVRLTLGELAAAGLELVGLTLATVVVGVLLVEVMSRYVFGLQSKTGSLIAAGASICGVSAVLTVAATIDADEEQIAYVAGAILLFDALTLVGFPLVGHWLSLDPQTFGIWAGLSMFSTGPVVAAGFAFDPVAGKWATLTKVARNSFIGLAALGYSVYFTRRTALDEGGTLRTLWGQFPKFLVGFALVVAVTNAGLLGPSTVELVNLASSWLFTVAFVGLGFDIRLARLRGVGLRPVAVVTAYLLVMGAATLAAIDVLF